MKSKRINPKTGGKNYFMNPESEWIITQQDDLRIVSDKIWHMCELRKFKPKSEFKRKQRHHVKYPFSDLVFCGVCNSPKNIADRKEFVCSGWKRHRICSNARRTKMDIIIKVVFKKLHTEIEKFSDIQWDGYFIKNKHKNNIDSKEKTNKLEEINNKINYLVSAIDEKNINIPEVFDKLSSLQHQRASIRVDLDSTDDSLNYKNTKQKIIEHLKTLQFKLSDDQKSDEIRTLLTTLVSKITFSPIFDKKTGETCDVILQPDAWLTFYRLIQNQEFGEFK